MQTFTASAPGKIILFGEHAVVYGQPAIAVPVTQVQATATVEPIPGEMLGTGHIIAPQINLDAVMGELPPDNPLVTAIRNLQTALGAGEHLAFRLRIHSTIPVAAGLGSGAAVSAAVIRAFSAFLGRVLPDEDVSVLAYQVEKIHHGTPSGIDNTVVVYARPVYFIRGQPIETFRVSTPFTIVIADTGISSPTAIAVGDVRKAWQVDKARYERIFAAVGEIAREARQAIENGQPAALGPLMNANHDWLCKMGVSSPELDHLVRAARGAGALGAKLSGGGRGGNMIALATPETAEMIAGALESAGAVHTIVTEVGGNGDA